MTGATGSIGKALYGRLLGRFRTTGFARRRPSWWRDEDRFIEIDLATGSWDALNSHVTDSTQIVHVLNLTHLDPQMNERLTATLAKIALERSASRFIYISSMRVYGGLYGSVDESTPAKPHRTDGYALAKLACENLLEQQLATKRALSICRIGSVFSRETPAKIPAQLNSRGRFLQKGQTTHLISANNVASALRHILLTEPNIGARIYNITQEADGLNNYCQLADQLAKCERAHATYKAGPLGRWLRNFLFTLKLQTHSGPYVQCLENQLISEGFNYNNSLIDELRDAARYSD